MVGRMPTCRCLRTPMARAFALVLPLALGACANRAEPRPDPAAASLSSGVSDATTAAKLQAALAGPHRDEAHRARDKYRHPLETLGFFGLRDDMTVVELWPGGGWYTEVLAPVLKQRGHLVVTSFDPKGPADSYETEQAKDMNELLTKNAALFGTVTVAVVKPPEKLDLGPPGSADLVLTFRNLHNWIADGKFADKVLLAAYQVLKPGGVLGVVEHRAKPGQSIDSGYVEEAVAIKLCEDAGFKLVAKSEINANPKDTKDYPEGVWTLPPSLALKDKDRDKYLAIGESDRMTLRFVKPGAQP